MIMIDVAANALDDMAAYSITSTTATTDTTTTTITAIKAPDIPTDPLDSCYGMEGDEIQLLLVRMTALVMIMGPWWLMIMM